jgi:hypothetical protein
VAPPSVARGAWKGIGQRRGCRDRAVHYVGTRIPLRGRIFLRKKLLLPPPSYHSLRRLSRIPPRKAVVAPTMTYSEAPQVNLLRG